MGYPSMAYQWSRRSLRELYSATADPSRAGGRALSPFKVYFPAADCRWKRPVKETQQPPTKSAVFLTSWLDRENTSALPKNYAEPRAIKHQEAPMAQEPGCGPAVVRLPALPAAPFDFGRLHHTYTRRTWKPSSPQRPDPRAGKARRALEGLAFTGSDPGAPLDDPSSSMLSCGGRPGKASALVGPGVPAPIPPVPSPPAPPGASARAWGWSAKVTPACLPWNEAAAPPAPAPPPGCKKV